jgi:hypothetical protein
VQVFRPVILIVATFGMVWFFSAAALGLGGTEANEE